MSTKSEIERLRDKKRKRLLQEKEVRELEKLRREEEPTLFDKLGKGFKKIDKALNKK